MALVNNIALITGGASGVGLATAKAFLDEGVKVIVLLDLHESLGVQDLRKIYPDAVLHYRRADVSSEEQVRDAFKITLEKFGRLDIVVHSAGIYNDKDWKEEIKFNLTELFFANTRVKVIVICPGATVSGVLSRYSFNTNVFVDIDCIKKKLPDFFDGIKIRSPESVGKCIVEAIIDSDNGKRRVCSSGEDLPGQKMQLTATPVKQTPGLQHAVYFIAMITGLLLASFILATILMCKYIGISE